MSGGRGPDAAWFPVDLHVPRREFGFLQLDIDVLERSVFLDTRIAAPLDQARFMAVPDVAPAQSDRVSWLLHTSFCCSTLLARALHLAPSQVVLKEPLVLRRLADARHAGQFDGGLLATAVALLAQPWSVDGAVIVKPTHAALNIAPNLLAASPGSRALVLTSSLEDFVLSNIKKTPETQAKIPALAERALAAGRLAARLPRSALEPPDLLCAATLRWAAQRELCLALLDLHGVERVRILDADALMDDLPSGAEACARWLNPASRSDEVRARARAVAGTNAKAVDAHYDAERRRRDAAQIRQRFEPQVNRALAWFDRFVGPAMRPDAMSPQTRADAMLAFDAG